MIECFFFLHQKGTDHIISLGEIPVLTIHFAIAIF